MEQTQLALFTIQFLSPEEEKTEGQPTETETAEEVEKRKQRWQKVGNAADLILNPVRQALFLKDKVVELAQKGKIPGLRVIQSEEELSHYKNAQHNSWMIQRTVADLPHYYVMHPKIPDLLIESGQFSQYVFEEYRAELINYCRSHCNAKSIKIVKSIQTDAGVGGSYKGVGAEIDGGAGKNYVLDISSPQGLKKESPLKQYYWITPSLKEAITGLKNGGAICLSEELDTSFGMDINCLKAIEANLNYSHHYLFSIHIEC